MAASLTIHSPISATEMPVARIASKDERQAPIVDGTPFLMQPDRTPCCGCR